MGGSWSQWLFWLFKYNWHLLTNQYFPRNCIVFIVQLCVCLPATTVWAEICIWFLGFLWELPLVIVCDTTCELWVEYSHRFFFSFGVFHCLLKHLAVYFHFQLFRFAVSSDCQFDIVDWLYKTTPFIIVMYLPVCSCVILNTEGNSHSSFTSLQRR